MSSKAQRRPVLSSLLALSTVSACSSWQMQPLTPAQLVAEQHPRAVRVDRADGTRLVLVAPQVIGDSLVASSGNRRARVALVDIRQIAVSRSDGAKTAALVIGMVAVAAVAFFAIAGPAFSKD